ncbi:alpha/beta hydrolase [Prosthecobacter vanneervenii]|uniref:Acetyl esterase/lipase n=1 Tax=Prosthecobacter vanneervenii TaxID=48466 RepID=A0A7W7YDA0_9BACT|nr:alpha/beta hydrolase [Prosthecobacter vanneervenii]MBB5034043.1 acetyl esterase/lipase [Prosthecobacter vanneervenii]
MKWIFFLMICAAAAYADNQADIEYARVGDVSLKLDLHRPQGEKPPLIVYVHGGAWRGGSKEDVPIGSLLERGYAIASVNYRLSTQAVFPAQVHDIKAAIRFLRANAGVYHINADKIVIIGSSAGGHLAALVGVTNGVKELEGTVGENLEQSSDVQGIVSFFGASNLMTILSQSTPKGREFRIPALKLLLGDTPDKKPELAKLASPVAHLDKKDPSLMLIHGDADPQMPPPQSDELAKGYRELGLPVTLIVMPGSRHGGAEFYDDERTAIVSKFLDKVLH